jgi:hypothetical protein
MERKTVFSRHRTYRYTLWREWDQDNPKYVMFIGLNPSTADEARDDQTVRRCISFAKAWGYGGLCMTNIFAFRATKPVAMKAHPRPVGRDNNKWLLKVSQKAGIVVAAWGAHGDHRARSAEVLRLLRGVHCLGITKSGNPRHPLYVRGTTKPRRYKGTRQ